LVQLSCETDFVAKTDRFQDSLEQILASIHKDSSTYVSMDKSMDEATLNDLSTRIKLLKNVDPDSPTQQNVLDGIKYTISKTQENCQLQRVFKATWKPENG
jgi:translation elongation factor EF-Ts